MSSPLAIPPDVHTDFRAPLTEALGSFWSSVFGDRELVDGLLTARVLSACQLQLDILEALSLRDHRTSPTFSRRHWYPLVIRLSARNTGRGLTVGMRGSPVIGAQMAGVFLAGEVFEVGGNAAYSRVNTYPLNDSVQGGRLVSVATALCDSISRPQHVLAVDRDFSVEDGVLVIRKECDPFDPDVTGYRIVSDGDDRVAVLWACDAAVDTNNVSDFVGYPLGVDTPSTEAASHILSSLWDVVTFGISPGRLNAVLGAVFDVPHVTADTTVESVTTSGGVCTVVTADAVYRIPEACLSEDVTPGAELPAGTLLTNELSVYHSLSPDEINGLVTRGTFGRLTLLPGSILGVDVPVYIENLADNPIQVGGWFKLNAGDTADSPFWKSVFARTTQAERTAFCTALAGGGTSVNPLLSLGYLALANTLLVTTTRGLRADPCAGLAMAALHRLVPSAASLAVLQTVAVDDTYDIGVLDDAPTASVTGFVTITTHETVDGISLPADEQKADDDVSFSLYPVSVMEV